MTNSLALAWIVGNDTGMSSKAIWAWMMGQRGDKTAPSDADDLGRCLRLLALVPEWEARIAEMASVSPYWAALAPRWQELKATYLADTGGSFVIKRGGMHATYELMKSILRPVEKSDRNFVRLSDEVSIRFGK